MQKKFIKTTLFFALLILMGQGCLGTNQPVSISTLEALDPNGLNCRGFTPNSDGAPVELVKLSDGYCYPEGIFTEPTEPDECDSTHYHYTLLSIDGTQSRFDEGACGAASNAEFENRGEVYVDSDTIRAWNSAWAEVVEDETVEGAILLELEIEASTE